MSEEGITDEMIEAGEDAWYKMDHSFACNAERDYDRKILQGDLAAIYTAMRAKEQSSLPPVKGTIAERVARAICEEVYGPGSTSVYFDTLRMDERYRLSMSAATAAIESMPIQKMVEGLERARQNIQSLHQATYGFGNAELVERWCAQIDSLLASVRSDAHD